MEKTTPHRKLFTSLLVLTFVSMGTPGAQVGTVTTGRASAAAAPVRGTGVQLPAFDVVSIKPHKDEGMMMRFGERQTPDGVDIDGATLQMILKEALGLSDDRILNEPDWAKSSRFDIEAKVAPEDAPQLKSLNMQQRDAMMLPVLEDRFRLKFHHETRDLQVYTLVAAKGGPKLKESPPGEAGITPPSPGQPGGDAPLAMKPGAGGEGPSAAPRMMMRMSTQGMTLQGPGITMAFLAQMISRQIGATVVEKTGLTGKYDVTLSWMPEPGMGTGPMPMMGPPPGAPPAGGDAQSQPPVGPSIFAALQEQLGLKLEARKEPVDVIVIDQIGQPTQN